MLVFPFTNRDMDIDRLYKPYEGKKMKQTFLLFVFMKGERYG